MAAAVGIGTLGRFMLVIVCLGVLPRVAAHAQEGAPVVAGAPRVLPLWSGNAPGALGDQEQDRPTLTTYLPANPTRPLTAVIVIPGGAYHFLATDWEGHRPAEYLNSLGLAAFVLKYRISPYRHPVELGDAQRAIRLVRARASEWGIAPDRIGVLGFSAGGHLASTAATHFDAGNPAADDPVERVSSRPDFAVLGYPVISLVEPWTHEGTKVGLLGPDPDPGLVRQLSSETQVTAQTPPTFLYHTTTDKLVPVEHSLAYYQALRKAGVPAELHVFGHGPHGTGMGTKDPALAEWPKLLAHWLRGRGFLP